MRIARSTLIGTAVAAALFGRDAVVHAQTSGGQSSNQGQLEEVIVTGFRYSLEQSIEAKRNAATVVEVVTAEDIGKMPDKNIADALQRLPGVTISAAGANEGGFDEADRVSLRGSNPSLTLTLLNGHAVASGDWFVLDQTGTVGRSVSYTLLPSELVKAVVVHKSSEAGQVEGGIAGTVDIITRKPLDSQKPVTIEVSAGAVHADLPDKTDPQFSALANWVNGAHNFGILGQVFYEERDLRRDGTELLGYDKILSTSNLAAAHPDLANVVYPHDIGAALFQQQRKRSGGVIDVEFQPSDSVTIDASGFYSKLEATNINTNFLNWAPNYINGGNGQAGANGNVPGLGLQPGYVVKNGTLTSATFAPVAGTFYSVYDQISRPDEGSSTSFGNLDINWKASDSLKFFGQFGVTEGHGLTPTQDVSETQPSLGSGAGYSFYGITSAPAWNLGNSIVTSPAPGGVPVSFGWIFGEQSYDVVDKETYAKIDADFTVTAGAFKDFTFGARYAEHQRHLWGAIGQGPGCQGEACPPGLPANSPLNPFNPANYPIGNGNYPSNYGNGLGGPYPTAFWTWTPQQLAAYDTSYTNRDPVTRHNWGSDYGIDEKDPAVYAQANFAGTHWSGNVGLRWVQTKESVVNNVSASATTPGVITTSLFGPYVVQTTNSTYNDVLPSANLKLDLNPQLVARFAAAETLSRPDYSALATSISLVGSPIPGGPPGAGSGGNPNIKPIKSTNLDAGLEWYFARRSLLAATAFYMKLKDYVTFGTDNRTIETFNNSCPTGCPLQYNLTVPVNADGRVYGAELSYQQPFFRYFGIIANYTYANGKQTSQLPTSGDDRLAGTSKNSGNLIGYFETAQFSARVAYNYRSEFLSGLDRSTAFTQAAIGTLDASLGYQVTEGFSLTLDGLNLNNPRLKYFALNEDQPRAFYKNGSQYYATARFKF
jgi:iron complex outermembrane receptor protein